MSLIPPIRQPDEFVDEKPKDDVDAIRQLQEAASIVYSVSKSYRSDQMKAHLGRANQNIGQAINQIKIEAFNQQNGIVG